MPNEEAEQLVSFFRKLFVYEPRDRMSLAEMLKDPCMEIYDADTEEYGFLTIREVNKLSKTMGSFRVLPITPSPVRAVRTGTLVGAAWNDNDGNSDLFVDV